MYWLYQFSDADQDNGGFIKIISSCQAIVMGRLTFDHVVGMEAGPWPYGDTSDTRDGENTPTFGQKQHSFKQMSDKFTLVNLIE